MKKRIMIVVLVILALALLTAVSWAGDCPECGWKKSAELILPFLVY